MFHPYEIAFCGLSNSGKTTLLEKLVRRFTGLGFRVGCFKQGFHRIDIDREGKDSDLFRQAGATPVMVADREKEAVISSGNGRLPVNHLFEDNDLLFIEGHKELPLPKMLFVDREQAILSRLEQGMVKNVLALVHDGSGGELESLGLPCFNRDEESAVAEFIEDYFRRRADAFPLYGLLLEQAEAEKAGNRGLRLSAESLPRSLKEEVSRLGAYCERVFVACSSFENEAACLAQNQPLIRDSYLELGALGSLLSAMRRYPEAAWLATTGKLPAVKDESLNLLVKGRSPFRYATAVWGDSGPSAVIYEPKSYPRLLLRHAAGENSLISFLDESRVERLQL